MAEDRVQSGLVEPAVVVDPAPQYRIPHAGQIIESLVTTQMEPPPPHRLPHFGRGPIAHRRAEVDEALAPSILRPSGTEGVSEKVKFLIGIRTTPVVILAVDDFRLVRMQLQLATL